MGCQRQIHDGAGNCLTDLPPYPQRAYCRERGLYPKQVQRWSQGRRDAIRKLMVTLKKQKALEKLRSKNQREIEPETSPRGHGKNRNSGAREMGWLRRHRF